MVRRKYIIPKARKEWTGLASDLIFVALTIFLLNTIRQNYEKPMEAVMAFRGKSLPSFHYVNLSNGNEEELADRGEKVIILNVWATWCPPCRKEMPELDEVQKKYGKQGLSIIALSDETPQTITSFVSKKPFSFATGYFAESNSLLNSINARPVSILLVDGRVKDIVVGARGSDFFSDWVKPFLKP